MTITLQIHFYFNYAYPTHIVMNSNPHPLCTMVALYRFKTSYNLEVIGGLDRLHSHICVQITQVMSL